MACYCCLHDDLMPAWNVKLFVFSSLLSAVLRCIVCLTFDFKNQMKPISTRVQMTDMNTVIISADDVTGRNICEVCDSLLALRMIFFHFWIILLCYQSWTQDRFQWLIINECSQDVQGSIFTRSHWLQYQRWKQALVVSIRLGSLCLLNLTATVASNYVFTKF